MRLDFSVIDILLVKCKIQHFINHWPSVNQRDAANIGPLSGRYKTIG